MSSEVNSLRDVKRAEDFFEWHRNRCVKNKQPKDYCHENFPFCDVAFPRARRRCSASGSAFPARALLWRLLTACGACWIQPLLSCAHLLPAGLHVLPPGPGLLSRLRLLRPARSLLRAASALVVFLRVLTTSVRAPGRREPNRSGQAAARACDCSTSAMMSSVVVPSASPSKFRMIRCRNAKCAARSISARATWKRSSRSA